MSTITEGGTNPLDAYVAAEEAWTKALQAAVANHGNWGDVQQAYQVVKQTQSALRAAEERSWTQ